MQKPLIRSGNSKVLVISRDMIAHLGLEDDRIEVQYSDGRIVLTRPLTFEEAKEATKKKFGRALKNLGQ